MSFVLCDLADNHFRVSRAEAKDIDNIKKCIFNEERRKEKGEALIKQKREIVNKIQIESAEGGILGTGSSRLLTEVQKRKQILKEPEAAEDQLRSSAVGCALRRCNQGRH